MNECGAFDARFTCEAVLRRSGSHADSHVFLLECGQGLSHWKGNSHVVEVSIRVLTAFSTAITNTLALLPTINARDLSIDDSTLAIGRLNEYLTTLLQREDVLNDGLFRDLFETGSATFPVLGVTSEVRCHPRYKATCLLSLPDCCIVGLEDPNPQSVWDFLLCSTRASYAVLPIQQDSLRPKTLFFGPSAVTVSASLPQNEVLLGTADGQVSLVRLIYEDKWKSLLLTTLKVHEGKVVAMCSDSKTQTIVSAGSDNTLRIMRWTDGNISITGGGSLRARLKTANLRALALDPIGRKLFLGTTINRVLIYSLDDGEANYQESISTRGSGPIVSLEVDSGNIMACDGPELLVWSNHPSPQLVIDT